MRLIVKNWRDFQHYDKRRPPWIKLHRGLLDDYEFQCLPVASRALAPMLWLLASESDDGAVEYDLKKLGFRLRMSDAELADALKPLIDKGFFECVQDASAPLATLEVSAHQEEERETEEETEKRFFVETADAVVSHEPASKGNKPPPCPYDDLVALYHQELPSLQRVVVLTGQRKEHLQARWRQIWEDERFDTERGLELFRGYFRRVASSKFLTGKVNGSGDRKTFRADLAWLVKPENFAKVIEGKYS